ncbi:hypothetical protein GH714_004257 [Hevea brasiliensis]|uniref:Rx N-terminal domain-containing protein n=1 Tax=Hevea brasiliensis TaxID=3981 RepID=A0A6A6KXG6_HEVBR|nr:hypothetical protein GH714_004257 [Hevea brasiliensis]
MEIVTTTGGAILTSVFTALFDQLASQDLLKYAREGKVLNEVNEWKDILEEIYVVLDDAEEQQMTNQLVKLWANKLRDLAYDVEDILDEFDFDARRRKLEAGAKVRKLIPASCAGLKFNAKMISKIKEITIRLEEIRSQKNRLDLRVIAGESSSSVRERRPTTSVVNKEEVYGREEDKKAILEFLNAESSEAGVSVISIIGMGGLGKTTLAQLVFNEAKMNFDLAAWVLVGDDFDVFRITQTIFQWFGGHYDGKDLNFLQVKLKEMLLEEKFLIVLDDVWNEKYGDWNLPWSFRVWGKRK